MGQKTGEHTGLVGKTGKMYHLECLDVDGRIIFKWIFNKQDERAWP
jgi:hypothetical protein